MTVQISTGSAAPCHRGQKCVSLPTQGEDKSLGISLLIELRDVFLEQGEFWAWEVEIIHGMLGDSQALLGLGPSLSIWIRGTARHPETDSSSQHHC